MKNEKLKKALDYEKLVQFDYMVKSVQRAEEIIAELEPLAEQLEEAGIEYWASANGLFISTPHDEPKNKPNFTAHVKRLAKALDSLPDVHVGESQYRAKFCGGKVLLSMFSPEDCQMIEVEETTTRKVLKPHPGCVAALAVLEDLA